MTDLDAFEKGLSKQLRQFVTPLPPRPKARPAAKPVAGLSVCLVVRRPGEVSDYQFTHQTNTISKFQARIEAEHAARKAGWPIVAYVVAYT